MRSLSLPLLTLISLSLPPRLTAAVDFVHEVAPVIKKHCGDCHLGVKKKGGLSLNTREDWLAGSENGKIAEPGKPDDSLLLKLLISTDKDEYMPPKGDRVPPEKIAVIRQWIAEGMMWDDAFTFAKSAYEPPLKPRRVELPPIVDGREHPVDRILDKYLADKQVTRPAAIDDATFLRRVSMDITGLLPGPEEAAAFLADKDPAKRAQSIKNLLARTADYTEHWLSFWNDLLRNDYQGTGYIDGGRKAITDWLYRALAANMPYDQFARELLAPPSEASSGFINGIKWRGNVNASQVREIQFSQSVSQVFLGINMKCASCHDSFVDRWKLNDAYALAAVFSDHEMEIFRCDKATGRKAQAGWIFPELGSIQADAAQPERLKQLAALMTHPENGRFTRTMVNRIWHRLMGRGIVHPVDAMDTEPWNSDLLDYLAVYFAEEKYDVKKLIAFICRSQAYQSHCAAVAEGQDKQYVYRGPLPKRLTAEQFVDAVWRLTGTAPAQGHASVPRGVTAAGVAAAEKLEARWIWSRAAGSAGAPAGETILLRKELQLPAATSSGSVLAVSCDNECEVFLNGKSLGKSDNWEAPLRVPLPKLKAGTHMLQIKAKNGGSGANPAGLIVQGRILMGKSPELAVRSDASWQWADPAKPELWQPAAEVANQAVWTGVHGALMAALAGSSGGGTVRASVGISDLLQRALGRPNREQIVSMRPDYVTTLEAIDLANGGILADLLKRGAQNLLSAAIPAEELPRVLFQRALTRDPSEEEIKSLQEVLGDSPSPHAVEDALWLLLMLPEFQFVR